MATLTISSKNYSSWSLRGWLLARFAGISFEEKVVSPDDPDVRAEILLLSSSIRVPRLQYDGIDCWDTLAIAEFLNELCPQAQLLPDDRAARAHCRSICGEMHSGFTALRSALPMNIKAHFKSFKIWSRAQADIDHIVYPVAARERVDALVNVLLHHGGEQTLVFARTRADVADITRQLQQVGFAAGSLSGEMDQAARLRALSSFRSGQLRALVATDVAARGIDVQDIARVVQIDVPTDADTYTHRSGRTGRAGRKGTSALLVPPSALKKAAALLQRAGV